jgi:3',5'-cyclic AMP phosphodiesterase CpdA
MEQTTDDGTDAFEPGAHPGATMARLAAPTAERRTRLAVIADPHVSTRAEGTSKLYDRTERHLRAAVADASARDVDAVVSVGDLTKDGEPWNYDAVDAVLSDLDVPFLAVPGNHDVPKAGDDHGTPSVSEFAARYAPTGAYPFATEVGGVDLVGLNTAGDADFLFDTHDGGVDPRRRDAVADALDAAPEPLVVAHHNLPATYAQFRAHRDAVEPEMGIPPVTRDGEGYVETLAAGGTSLLLTGHLHVPATSHEGGVRELVAATTCSFPQGYLTLTVDSTGTVARFHPVAGRAGMRHAYAVRSTESVGSRGQTALAADRLARFPLVDE